MSKEIKIMFLLIFVLICVITMIQFNILQKFNVTKVASVQNCQGHKRVISTDTLDLVLMGGEYHYYTDPKGPFILPPILGPDIDVAFIKEAGTNWATAMILFFHIREIDEQGQPIGEGNPGGPPDSTRIIDLFQPR